MNSGMACLAAPTDALMRSVPDNVSRKLPACSIATRIVESAGATLSTNCAPASDSDTLRVVRLKSRTPMRASSAATAVTERGGRHAELGRGRPKAAMARDGQNGLQLTQTRSFHCPKSLNVTCLIVRLVNAMPAVYRDSFEAFFGASMQIIDKIYIDGAFVTPHGSEMFDLFNPATEQVIGQVRLADAQDARDAIAAAKRAFPAFSRTSPRERIDMLKRMHEAVVAKEDELYEAITEEYGAPVSRGRWMAQHASSVLLEAAKVLQDYAFTRRAGSAEVVMQPLGVAGLITPWNSDAGFICGKLAAALAAGCTAVIKPSEMSAIQTRIVTEALHEAGLPAGVFNIVTGRGDIVGAEISSHPDVAKLSFTGSTAVGKTILRTASDTLQARDARTRRQVARDRARRRGL